LTAELLRICLLEDEAAVVEEEPEEDSDGRCCCCGTVIAPTTEFVDEAHEDDEDEVGDEVAGELMLLPPAVLFTVSMWCEESGCGGGELSMTPVILVHRL
jgi:hypothetical protein